MKLSTSLKDNITILEEFLPLQQSFDLITRELTLFHIASYFIGINGYADDRVMHKMFSDLQQEDFSNIQEENRLEQAILDYIPCAQVVACGNLSELARNLLSGTILLFFEGVSKGFIIDLREYPGRSIEQPENEKVIRGAKDGFVETLLFNANLIRRRIRSPQLTFEIMSVGSESQTDVSLAYMRDEINKEYLDFIKQKIKQLHIASLTMGTKSMEELLFPHRWYHPLPSVFRTERPDVACSYLLEGYILLMVDTTPSVLILPCNIFQFSQSPEDYYKDPFQGNYIRFYRFMCCIVSLFLLPVFLLLSSHPELLPPGITLLPTGELGPVRLFIYVMFAEIAMDLFKYSSSHSPEGFSGSLSIVGGLLIGEIAVKLQWISMEIVFYTAATVLCSLAISSIEFSEGLRTYRILLLLLTGFLGINGFLVGLLLILLSVITTPGSLGKSYFWPLFPYNGNALRCLIFRYPTRKEQPPNIWKH